MTRPVGRGPGGMQLGPGEKALDFWPSLRRLVRLLRAQRGAMVGALVLSVAAVAAAVSGPKIIGAAIDQIYGGLLRQAHHGAGIDFGRVGDILMWAVAIYILSSLCQYAQGYLLNGAVQRAMFELRRQVEEKLHRLPLSYFDKQPRGELLSRVTNDIDNLGQSLTQALSQLLVSVLTLVGVLVMMLWVSPLLTAVVVVVIPLVVVLTGQVMKRSQRRFVEQWSHTGKLNGQVEEVFSGHELVTVFGRRAQAAERFADENEELTAAAYKAQFVSGLVMPIMMFVSNLQYVGVCVVGGLRVASGSMSLGDVVAFIQYSRQFTQPLTQLASMANLLQSGVASAERVFAVLDADEQVPEEHGELPRPTRGRVEFDGVRFGYKPEKTADVYEPLIDGLDLIAEPGMTVAIVGHTGAGKTTLVNLVERFYEVDSGRITLDGIDIASVPRPALRSRIGMVLQDAWLFEGTIADNIRYGNLNATDADLRRAAEATFVDRFTHSLPDGYDTVIGDDAGNISAGERQLITIARAFLADPAILILDEATSSVDTRTEVLLQKAMHALRADRTSFVIAHRLSTIRDADVIVVMEAGRIVEQGSHQQLLDAGGAYARLYRAQFEGALVGDEELTGPAT
ncbi:ABC transporter ATP-binding protein [Tsukamurella sp. 8F]|uniref:ABC transporter ATP-binding protein n=1 Tax=Tsukamurella sp. 8F TaxID=3031961 RepID=UPI0023B8D7FB|nr:ABC transporter ATP-binding protein [Tsukamurella sp. 8F]MDF0589512.1 ABC transporter ATP-binding protein [Tsukamurella sp. 8F]